MDSRLFNNAREKAATTGLAWTTGVVRAVLLPSAWVPDFDAVYLSEIPSGTRIATSLPITGRTAADGLCAGSRAEFSQFTDSRLISQAVLFKDTGVDSTSELIFYIGEEDLVNAPFVSQGLDYFILPDLLTGGYFRV